MSDISKFMGELVDRLDRLENRLSNLETAESGTIQIVHPTSTLITTNLTATNTYTSADIRALSDLVPEYARGIFATWRGTASGAGGWIRISSSDHTPNSAAQQIYPPIAETTFLLMLPLGVDGAFKLTAGMRNFWFSIHLFGYWT